MADPERRPRSITLHYLRPGQVGPCEVAVTVERAGRGMTTATARFQQGGKDALIAVVTLGIDRDGPTIDHHPMPTVPGPDELGPREGGPVMSFRERFLWRPTFGPPMGELADEAITGGWLRFDDDEPIDDVVLLQVCDAWPPALFTVAEVPVGVPTLDLTVHFRHRPVLEPGWLLVRFRTTLVDGGYLEEDGEVWSEDGRLLAHSRQLAVAIQPELRPS